jgi:hypothetical protein
LIFYETNMFGAITNTNEQIHVIRVEATRLSENQNTTDSVRGIFEISDYLQLSLQTKRENLKKRVKVVLKNKYDHAIKNQ